MDGRDVQKLIDEFDDSRNENKDVATDQLLNAIFLTIAMRDTQERSFSEEELGTLRANLMRALSGPSA